MPRLTTFNLLTEKETLLLERLSRRGPQYAGYLANGIIQFRYPVPCDTHPVRQYCAKDVANSMLSRLLKRGFCKCKGYKWSLTEAGATALIISLHEQLECWK